MNEQGVLDSAILLLAMGEEAAAQVLRQLNPREVEKLSQAMAGLKATPRARVDEVLVKFHDAAGDHGTLVPDTGGFVSAVLNRALGADRGGLVAGRVLPPPRAEGLETLKWMTPDAIAAMLRDEHPQVVASILAHLERDVAGVALAGMDEARRIDVLTRIARLDVIRPDAMVELNEALKRLLEHAPKQPKASLGGAKAAAELLNQIGAGAETAVLEAIREADPELADRISDLMLLFDDLLMLEDRAVQTVLREVQNEQLTVALKGANPAVRDKVLKNMSQRAAETLREDIASMGPVRLTDVEAQQREIMNVVRRLVEEGGIQIIRAGAGGFV
jgi:flagellar motor switch protein FliG